MTQFIRPRLTALAVAVAMVLAAAVGGAVVGEVGFAGAVVDSGDKPITKNIDLVRIRDTRTVFGGPIGGPAGKLGTQSTEVIKVADTNGIPPDAEAVCINLTVLDATTDTFVTAFGALPRPNASTVNPGPGDTTVNGVLVPLDAGNLRIYNNAGSVNYFIDVSCYTEDHNHDDRYVAAESEPWAKVSANGTLSAGSPDVSSAEYAANPNGRYVVSFGRDVSNCAYIASVNSLSTQETSITAVSGTFLPGPDEEAVFVLARVNGAIVDTPFSLLVRC